MKGAMVEMDERYDGGRRGSGEPEQEYGYGRRTGYSEQDYSERKRYSSSGRTDYSEREPYGRQEREYNTRYPESVLQERLYNTRHPESAREERLYNTRHPEPARQERLYNTRHPESGRQEREYNTRYPESSQRRAAEARLHSGERPPRQPNGQPAPADRRRKRRKKRRMSGIVKIFIILLIALLIGFLAFRFMKNMMSSAEEPVNLTGQLVTVTIPEGATTRDIAKILKENKLIKNEFLFRLSSKMDGFDGTYRQGTYEIDTGLSKTQIMELLQTGVVMERRKVTIPEGFTVKQIAERAFEAGVCSVQEFIDECNTGTFDYEFLQGLPDREYRLEGYLFPSTYFLSDEMTAHDLIDMMLTEFDKVYKKYKSDIEASEYTLDQIVTIASMVEKEINVPEERQRAAGVIYNRLKQDGMALGIDATVLYAVGKTGGELTAEDLNTDSPYNTRKNTGLPLGPISNPGEPSIEAAVKPESHNYLYYVLEAQGKNNHVYCETYDDFLAAKEAYQASLQ